MIEAGVRKGRLVLEPTEAATRVEKLAILLGSARPEVDKPTGQHVDGLNPFPEVKSYVEIVGGEVTLETNVQAHTTESVGLRCKRRSLWRSKLSNNNWVVIVTNCNMVRILVMVNTQKKRLRILWR